MSDCQIETDEEMRFPDDYIHNIAERMHLYRELDNVETEEQLLTFENNLTDRFGVIPEAGQRLLQIVRIRQVAKTLGLEKIVFKNQMLYLYFVSNQESWFYQSPIFMKILQWLQNNPKKARMTEGREKLYITIKPVKTTGEVLQILNSIHHQAYDQL